jgi:hypothetical protein
LKILLTALQFILEINFSFSKSRISLCIAADVPNGNPRFFQAMMDMFDQVTAALFSQGRQVEVDDFAVVIGIQAKVG